MNQTYVLQFGRSRSQSLLTQKAADDELDLPDDRLGVVEARAEFKLRGIDLVHEGERRDGVGVQNLVGQWITAWPA